MKMDPLTNQLAAIERRIETACRRGGRARSEIKLLLASKKVEVERLQLAVKLGYNLLGENTAQELLQKKSFFEGQNIRWHFIGHLQSNKVKDILPFCELIHSVDRLSLAEEISKRAQQRQKDVDILVEVNTSGEEAKSGVMPDETIRLCRHISQLPHLKIKGLMTVAINSEEEKEVRACFRLLKELAQKIKAQNIENVEMQELSMGMSQDFEWAIEEGATLIRLGTAVFGQRDLA